MKSITKKLSVLSLSLLSILTGCGSSENKRTEYKGTYHVGVVDGLDRGADIIALVNSDKTIYTITEDLDSTYSICSSGGTILWGIKSNQILTNIATCSISDIKSWTVTFDENKIPNAITGINQDWIQPAIVDAIGLAVLALQDAFSTL